MIIANNTGGCASCGGNYNYAARGSADTEIQSSTYQSARGLSRSAARQNYYDYNDIGRNTQIAELFEEEFRCGPCSKNNGISNAAENGYVEEKYNSERIRKNAYGERRSYQSSSRIVDREYFPDYYNYFYEDYNRDLYAGQYFNPCACCNCRRYY